MADPPVPQPGDLESGMKMRRAVLGDRYVDDALASGAKAPVGEAFQDLVTRFAWGTVWARPGLDRRTRSCVTIAALVGGGHWNELALHLRGALNNGLSREEIGEVLLHTAIYCGVPAANRAFAVAREVLPEI